MAELTAAATTPEPSKEAGTVVSGPGHSVVESMSSPSSSPSCTESSDSESESEVVQRCSTEPMVLSSSQSEPSRTPIRPKGRKRIRQVHKWRATLRKEGRNSGKGYTTKKGAKVCQFQYFAFLLNNNKNLLSSVLCLTLFT